MLVWFIASFAAYFVKGLCGFANTLVFSSILGFGVNNINITPVDLLLGYPSNIILTINNRKSLKPSVWIPLALLVLAGNIPGAFLLKNINSQYIKIIFGIVVVIIALEMLLKEYSLLRQNNSKLILYFIGFISGIFCGLFGVGALLACYVGRVTNKSDEFVANMSAVFIVENTFRLVLYSAMGIITFSSLKTAIILIPFMLAGLICGILSRKVLDDKLIKKIIIILLIISGVILIVKNI